MIEYLLNSIFYFSLKISKKYLQNEIYLQERKQGGESVERM